MRSRRWLGALAAALALSGCVDLVGASLGTVSGNGRVVSEVRNPGWFTAVSNATGAHLDILQSDAAWLRVRAEENLLPYLRTDVVGGELRIYTAGGTTLYPTEPILIELDVVALQRITSSGSGHVTAPLLNARRLEIVSSGGGDISAPSLLADSLIVISSGAGDVSVSGSVRRQRAVLSGGGSLYARELQTAETNATLSGSGGATVRVRDRLRAVLSGSGSLWYYGNPSVQQSVTGSGRVERIGY